MSDSFEFTLHSPLSKEDWDKLTDVELERTERIWFKTPSGKKIDYIPADVLDKIRAEIDAHREKLKIMADDDWYAGKIRGYDCAIEIIDKYKAESEDKA
jgi:hypothetical protein